jgi:hypothetical protein
MESGIRTSLIRIVRGNDDRDDITAARNSLTAGFVPLPVGGLTFPVAVGIAFAVGAE